MEVPRLVTGLVFLLMAAGLLLVFPHGPGHAVPAGATAVADRFDFPLSGSFQIGYNVQNPALQPPGCTDPDPGDGCFSGSYGKWLAELQHAGEDWLRPGGTPVNSVANGRVVFSGWLNYPGWVVIVEHTLPPGVLNPWGGSVIYSMYAHLDSNPHAVGDIARGDPIGTILPQVGNSHLHFEIRRYGDFSLVPGLGLPNFANTATPPAGPGYTNTGVTPDTVGYSNPSVWINHHRTPSTNTQLSTQDLSGSLNPGDLASMIVGPGVSASNVSYTGADVAAGTFAGGGGIIGFQSGIILSSGNIANVVGPNADDATSSNNGLPGDTELTALSGFQTFDAAVLEFDFVPPTNTILFRYVFASDEYNEFVNTSYDDVFGFFVNGNNCALTPGTNDPVSINTINNGDPIGTTPNSNPGLFRNNDLTDGGGSIDTEMDGLTVVLTCTSAVNPGTSNHIKLAIADSSDHIYDASVFIETQSLKPPPPPPGTSNRDIVFIRGIDSEGLCDGAFTWVKEYFTSGQGKSLFRAIAVGKFLNFNYAGGGSYSCPRSTSAYTQTDTCDGIANAAAELKSLIDDQASSMVTVLAHSMGGLVTAYMIQANQNWASSHIASVVTFDSPLRGISNADSWGLYFASHCAGKASLADLNQTSQVVQTAAAAAITRPFYPLDATQLDILPLNIEYVPRDRAYFHNGDKPFNIVNYCGNPGANQANCEPPRGVDDDHHSVWSRRYDEHNGTDKAFLVGCAAALMADCSFLTAAVAQGATAEATMAIGPSAQEVQFTSSFGSVVKMTLTSPDGTAYGPDGGGPVAAYSFDGSSEVYQISNPAPGDWKVQLFGEEVPPGGEDVPVALLVLSADPLPPLDLIWGDVDCNGTIQMRDALLIARSLLPLPMSQTPPCPAVGATVQVGGQPAPLFWGDVDCNGTIQMRDALLVARSLLPLPMSQTPPCPAVGSPVAVQNAASAEDAAAIPARHMSPDRIADLSGRRGKA